MRLQVDWSLIPVPVTSPLTVAGITHLVRKMMPTDILGPGSGEVEVNLFCAGCLCEWLPPTAPESDCQNPECECHAEWNAQTPDLEKRALWGDK